MYKHFGLFIKNDINTISKGSKNKNDTLEKIEGVARCPETNEKFIFRFLRFFVFEIWLFNILRIVRILYLTFVVTT